VFDEGRLTDSHGRLADFRNTIIIMTSNLGSEVLSADTYGGNNEGDVQALVMRVVRASMAPEFINRIDQIVVFHSLTLSQMPSIASIQLGRLQVRDMS
jgi:ATP-dependent Clp protease ATP-binding subunit ClpB